MARLLDVKQVASKLSCHPQTVWKKLKNGEIPPPRKFGSMTRWLESDIDELIAKIFSDEFPDVPERHA